MWSSWAAPTHRKPETKEGGERRADQQEAYNHLMPHLLRPLHLILLFLYLACGVSGVPVSWEHSRSSSMCSSAFSSASPGQRLQEHEQENIFVRNCSSPDLQHPPLLVPPPAAAHIEALGHVLYNRTVAFIGDSTIQSQVRNCSR